MVEKCEDVKWRENMGTKGEIIGNGGEIMEKWFEIF